MSQMLRRWRAPLWLRRGGSNVETAEENIIFFAFFGRNDLIGGLFFLNSSLSSIGIDIDVHKSRTDSSSLYYHLDFF